MTTLTPAIASKSQATAAQQRAEQLDALEAVLPFHRRNQLAELLTDADVATLGHLADTGTGDNTLKALASDLGYLETWCLLATGAPLPWPAPASLALTFVAHHLEGPVERLADAEHGMPDDIAAALRARGLLRSAGPHAPATVRRRLTSWSLLSRARGVDDSGFRLSLDAVRLAGRTTHRPPNRTKTVSGDIFARLLDACSGDRLVDYRDRAILLLAFASGGRRRSEVAGLRVEDLSEDPAPTAADNTDLPDAPRLTIRLAAAPDPGSGDSPHVVLTGAAVAAVKQWMAQAKIADGPLFRRIDQWGNLDWRPLTPQSINQILKLRLARAGLDPTQFSAHGLRSGYLEDAASRGIPLPEAMRQSQHKSVTQATEYYKRKSRKPPLRNNDARRFSAGGVIDPAPTSVPPEADDQPRL